MTQQATNEAFQHIFGFTGDFGISCYSFSNGGLAGYLSETACMDGTWTYHAELNPPMGGESSSAFSSGGWSVTCDDADLDGISDDGDNSGIIGDNPCTGGNTLNCDDNCRLFANPGQEDTDSDGTGDVCDEDTICGTISKDIQAGVSVKIYTISCGNDILEAETETDSSGYYAFGALTSQRYLLIAEMTGYSFVPVADWVDIPQTLIQSYDFTATAD